MMNSSRSQIYKVDLNKQGNNDARVIAANMIRFGKPNPSVVDIGCACGDFGSLLSSHTSIELFGLEYDQGSIDIASEKRIYNEIYQVDLNNIQDEVVKSYRNKFDYIVALDVLEHTLFPEKTLSSICQFLKSDGEIIISLPNLSFGDVKLGLMDNEFFYTKTGILDETHFKFFTYKSIVELVSRASLSITESKYTTKPLSLVKHKLYSQVAKDPHSHVYQYIIRVKLSHKDKATLLRENYSAINISSETFKGKEFKDKALKVISMIAPPNSLQRNVMKKIYYCVAKG